MKFFEKQAARRFDKFVRQHGRLPSQPGIDSTIRTNKGQQELVPSSGISYADSLQGRQLLLADKVPDGRSYNYIRDAIKKAADPKTRGIVYKGSLGFGDHKPFSLNPGTGRREIDQKLNPIFSREVTNRLLGNKYKIKGELEFARDHRTGTGGLLRARSYYDNSMPIPRIPGDVTLTPQAVNLTRKILKDRKGFIHADQVKDLRNLTHSHPGIEKSPGFAHALQRLQKLSPERSPIAALDEAYNAGFTPQDIVKLKANNATEFNAKLNKQIADTRNLPGLAKFRKDFPQHAEKAKDVSEEIPGLKGVSLVKGIDHSKITGSKCFGHVCYSRPAHGRQFFAEQGGLSYADSAMKGLAKTYTYKPGDKAKNALIFTDAKTNKIIEMSGPNNSSVGGRNFQKTRPDLDEVVKKLGLKFDETSRIH